ncbi:MAG: TIGR03560 family F420-dependent LLM class oxidoreductase [Dehalococcoidia bacterium]|nr:TIGR03560 family F420-dependent LLM class oxidoreductase [Dehalococcoidia bacterium]
MEVGLMVEGQNGLSWERWRHILALAERLGFPSLHRSDHYFIGTQQSSIEAYLSLAVAAVETSRIRFGPLVSPVTFRHPVDVARMGAQLDVLSGGRFKLGLGAGWNEPEHVAYGLPFPGAKERLDRLEEALRLMRGLWDEGEATFEGRYYSLSRATMLPRATRGRPWVTIGGAGERRTLRLVAEYADEWNCVALTPETYRAKRDILERHCAEVGRDPAVIRRSMMIFGAMGRTNSDVERALSRLPGRVAGPLDSELRARLLARGMLVGTTDEVIDQLGGLAQAGVQEVQLQHLDFDSDEGPEFIAAEIAPRAASL